MNPFQRIFRNLPGAAKAPPSDSPTAVDSAVRLIEQGHAAQDAGNLSEARQCYEAAVTAAPRLAKAHMNLGNAHLAAGEAERALDAYNTAIACDPQFAPAHYSLGRALSHLNRAESALDSYRNAAALDPTFILPWIAIRDTLVVLDRFDEAITAGRNVVKIVPKDADAHFALSRMYVYAARLHDAAASLSDTIAIRPTHMAAHLYLAQYFEDFFRFDEAVAQDRKTVELAPNDFNFRTNLLFRLSHDESIDAEALFREHLTFGELIEQSHRGGWLPHENNRDPERILKVGFVSADLREHPVAYFVEPIFRILAQRPDIALYAYHNDLREDVVTTRIQSCVLQWRNVVESSDDAFSELVRKDQIDILIDLSGHTFGNRLGAFARKPAPIQASWIGYPGTTGLQAMDYYFSDRHFLPKDKFADQFTEKLVHLPATALFLPFVDSPPVHALPALRGRPFTFASFNRTAKINRHVVSLWARLLKAVPDAQMLVGGIALDQQASILAGWFSEEGIASTRVIFKPRSDVQSYLRMHHEVDLCLDTFPYSGGTTTSHALWMGVPTLTLAGKTPASRQTAALMANVNLDAFIASSAQEFIDIGQDWARRPDDLAAIRSVLRARVELSPYRNDRLISAAFPVALRTMWRRWCEEQPAAFIDVSDPE